MRNIKKQNVKRNPRVSTPKPRVSTPKPRSAQSKHHAAYRKAHPSPGRPKPIRKPGAKKRLPVAYGLPVAYAEVSPKVPPKVNPKVTRTHQVRHTTRNVQDANALGRFTADVGHGARTTVESYNFINPQTRSLRESTLFEVGVGTLTGQYTPEQGWGEAGRRVTEQPGRVVGEAAVEVGTSLIPVGALFKATKIGSAVRKANFLVKVAAHELPNKIPYKYGGTKMTHLTKDGDDLYMGGPDTYNDIFTDIAETGRRMTYAKINPLSYHKKYVVKEAIKKVKRKFTKPPPTPISPELLGQIRINPDFSILKQDPFAFGGVSKRFIGIDGQPLRSKLVRQIGYDSRPVAGLAKKGWFYTPVKTALAVETSKRVPQSGQKTSYLKKVKRKFTQPPFYEGEVSRGKGGSPRNYGDKKLKTTISTTAELPGPGTWEAPVATKAFGEILDYGATKTTYIDNTESAIRHVKTKVLGDGDIELHDLTYLKDLGGKKFGSLVDDKSASLSDFEFWNRTTRKKILPGLYKETQITPVGAFTEKTKVITTAPGKTAGSSKPPYAFSEETGLQGPYTKYYAKPGKTYEVEDWRAGGPQYAPVEYKDAVYFSAPVRVKGLTKKLKKAEERGAVIKTEKTLVPYGKWYTITPEQSVKGATGEIPFEKSYGTSVRYSEPGGYTESVYHTNVVEVPNVRGNPDDTRIILNTKWKYEDVPVSVTETRYTGPVASLGRTAPITGTIGASVGVLGYAEFSDSSVGQGGIRTKIKKAVGAI